MLALARYGSELKGNAEAMGILNGRRVGGDKGRDTQQKKKRARLPEIQAMISQGKSIKQIAVKLEVDPSTIYRALTPGKQRRKR
jgi:DNA invertase Pin-like site-specific DNA recombinase